MSIKKKLDRLERAIGFEDDLNGARDAVRFALEFGILTETTDVDKTVEAFALNGMNMRKIIGEIHRKSTGLPKLPSEEEDR